MDGEAGRATEKEIQDWRLEVPRCAPLQPRRMETDTLGNPSVGKPKPIEKEGVGENGILHINRKILKESSRVDHLSLDFKTQFYHILILGPIF